MSTQMIQQQHAWRNIPNLDIMFSPIVLILLVASRVIALAVEIVRLFGVEIYAAQALANCFFHSKSRMVGPLGAGPSRSASCSASVFARFPLAMLKDWLPFFAWFRRRVARRERDCRELTKFLVGVSQSPTGTGGRTPGPGPAAGCSTTSRFKEKTMPL